MGRQGSLMLQAGQAKEVRLAGAVGADQHVDRAQAELRRANGLVALHFHGIEGRHLDRRLSWSPADADLHGAIGVPLMMKIVSSSSWRPSTRPAARAGRPASGTTVASV